MRPYLKFIIVGGIFTGEGGGSLMAGLMFYSYIGVFQSMPYGESSAALFGMIALPFIIAGLASLPIGLSFLITGAVKRKAWLADNSFE